MKMKTFVVIFVLFFIINGIKSQCPLGYLCFNETQIVCPGGYYCPINNNKTHLCTEGNYCLKGSVNITGSCQGFSAFFSPCNAGTEKQNFMPFVFAIIISSTIGYILLILFFQKSFSYVLTIFQMIFGKLFNRTIYSSFSQELNEQMLDEGESTFDFEIENKNGIRVEFRNLTLYTTNKIILKNVNGMFEPGTITAIMGSSGAGKSSLSNSITGRLEGGKLTGNTNILINNKSEPISTRLDHGFVPQEDSNIFNNKSNAQGFDSQRKFIFFSITPNTT
jgi:ABC-type multidrug transport system fused ATPase/permease subunit